MMTQSVDQTSITDVTSRRHNDPPGLWIAVVTSSVALHLLLFWLMRYNNPFSLWFPQPSQAIIPIEVIEISPSSSKAKPPKPQVKAKTVSPPSANQESSTVTPRNENSGKINFSAIPKQRERNIFVSKSNTQLVPKQSVSTPKPIFTPTQSQPISEDSPIPNRRTPRQPISEDSPIPSRRTPRQPISEDSPIPSRRTPRQPISEDSPIPNRRTPRQPISEDSPIPSRRTPRQPISEDSPIPSRRTPRQPISEDSPIPSRRTPRQPISEDSPIPSRRTPRQPISEDSPIPSRRTPRQPISEDSPIPQSRKTPQPATGAGIIAILRFLTPDELTPDEQRILNPDPLPKGSILPKHIGSDEKQIDSISLKPNLDLPEKEFLVSLVIDQTGNFVQAEVVDRAIAPKERPKYEEFANSVFRGEKFQLARYPNGTPVLKLVNRLVRIKIQRR